MFVHQDQQFLEISDLEEAVHGVHAYFERKSEAEQNRLFEQKMSFLKGVANKLNASSNAWLHGDDHGHRRRPHGLQSSH